MFEILTLAFFGDCRSEAKRALLGPSVCKPSPAWTANTDPVRTPNAQGPNPYDTTVAAQIEASLVSGHNKSRFYRQEYFEPLNSNPGIAVSS
uniref:Uncharacterized protein n=1 Tax=Cryptomonas curvata TaxID=233186 RepID=A0A6T7Z0Q0_9CRYP